MSEILNPSRNISPTWVFFIAFRLSGMVHETSQRLVLVCFFLSKLAVSFLNNGTNSNLRAVMPLSECGKADSAVCSRMWL